MASMKFYNMKTKKSITTSNYKPTIIKGKKMAVATVGGTKMYAMMKSK
jgi:hypothetical protein